MANTSPAIGLGTDCKHSSVPKGHETQTQVNPVAMDFVITGLLERRNVSNVCLPVFTSSFAE
jgi:hypothetical protein